MKGMRALWRRGLEEGWHWQDCQGQDKKGEAPGQTSKEHAGLIKERVSQATVP